MTRATLLLLLAALAITATMPLRPSQSLTDGRTALNASSRPPDGSGRVLHAFSGTGQEEALSPTGTDGGNPAVAVGPAYFMALGQEAGDTKADGSDFPTGPSAASLDVGSFALATPALRPLASDCRLPCYGVERKGPASWYRDWRYGPGALYAAIPGFVDGSVVSVVVCTFPDGQANCHTFPVTDSCQCFRHTPAEIVVDLSPAAFVQFQPDLLRGIVMVTVTVLR